MSSKNPTPTSQAESKRDRKSSKSRRLNVKALILMSLILGVSVPGVFALRYWQTTTQRSSLLKQAKDFFEKRDPSRALTYINRYLEQVPNSAEGLTLKAEILAATAVTPELAGDALQVNEQAIRALGSKAGLPMKRRSVELNLRMGKFQTAITQAREILGDAVNAIPGKGEPGDAATHRMMALAMYMSDKLGTDQKNSQEVIHQLELAWAADPSDIATALDLAMVYSTRSGLSKDESLAKSNEILDRIVSIHPKSLEVRLTRYKLFIENNLPDKAIADAKEAVKLAPDNMGARLAYSEALRLSGDNIGALQQIDMIPEADRNRPEVLLARGLAEITSNKIDRAVEEWRQGLVLSGGNDAETTWRLAFVLLNLGRINEADPLIEQFKRLSGSAEAQPESQMLDAVKLMRQGQFDQAITLFEGIRSKVSSSLIPQANFMLGQCYQAKGNAVQATDAYRRAAKTSNRWATPWLALAEQAAANGSLDNAINELSQGLTAMPADPTLLLSQARMVWRSQLARPYAQRDYTGIERIVRKLEEVAPNDPGLAIFKADFVAARTNIQDAVASLGESARKQPNNIGLWIAWASGLSRTGKFAEARKVLDECRQTTGDHADIRLALSQLAQAQGDENYARTVLSEKPETLPEGERPAIYKALGDLLLKQKDLIGATKAYESWQALKPSDPAPLLSLVQVALTGADDELIHRRVEALKGKDPKDVYWRLARIQELLRIPPQDVQKPEKLDARMTEALNFSNQIIESGTAQAQGLVLRAAVQERRGKLEEAVTDLRKAIDLEGGAAALRPLCQILARTGRFNEIEQLRVKIGNMPILVEQMIAEIAVQTGKAELARQLGDRLLEQNPEDLGNNIWYARLLSSLGQKVAAEESLRKYAERRGVEPSPWMALLVFQVQNLNKTGAGATLKVISEKVKSQKPELLLAQAYEVANLPSEADTHYRAALKLYVDDPITAQAALTFYSRYNRKPEIEAILREIIRRSPNLNWARRQLALQLSDKIGDEKAWKEAYDLISQSAATVSDEPISDRLVRSIVLARGGELSRRAAAITELEKLIPTLADPSLAHEVLARIYSDDATRLADARKHAEAAIAQNSDSASLIEFCVELAVRANDMPAAEKYLASLDVMDPGGLKVLQMRARVLAKSGRAGEGAAVVERYIERLKVAAQLDAQREAESVIQARNLLVFMVQLGPFDQVEAACRKVAGLWPRLTHVMAPAVFALGRVDEALAMLRKGAESGDWREATINAVNMATSNVTDTRVVKAADDLIEETLKRLPNQLDVLQAKAFLRHKQRKFDDELETYALIRKINPQDVRFLNNLAWTMAENLQRYEDGLKVIDEAIARIGRRPSFLDTRGVILTRMGRYKEAIADLESAREAATIISDGQPLGAIHFHLARAYLLNGQADKAKEMMTDGKKLGLSDSQLEPTEIDDYRKLTASR